MESVKHRYTARSSILPHDFCMYLLPRFFAGNKTEDSSRVEFANRVTSSAFLCFTLAKIVYCWRNVPPELSVLRRVGRTDEIISRIRGNRGNA